ncbi:MFS transporter [candidate division KSB1 bacterium]|nr:MFS transporter [candidate division KSB1 bacterium]
MITKLKQFFAPAPHIEPVPENEVRHLYKKYRWSTLESTFLGYAMFYLVRNNMSTVAKDIEGALHYDHSMIGSILAVTAIMYGLGKFLMGSLSDRSNPRKFMAVGLLLTALFNFAFGSVANYNVHFALWAMNGFIQGMGWPPCGRSIGHWYSLKERGSVFAIWNVAHNIGGGLAGILAAFAASNYGWQAAFYFPGTIAVIGSIYLFWRLRDTPQSVGLPRIEEYKKDDSGEKSETDSHEKELSTRELFVENIFKNKYLWVVAFANFFVYIVRYSMLDWGPTYLREIKDATLAGGGIAILIIEFGGIPSTLLMGWLSDKVGGRRGMVSLLCMIPIFAAFTGIYLNPAGNLWLDMLFLAIIGFFVYPPVMLLGVYGLDLTSKKAVGTAAGFIGLFGYLGRAVQAKGFGWMVHHYGDLYGLEVGWNMVIFSILGCTVLAILILGFTWNLRPKA